MFSHHYCNIIPFFHWKLLPGNQKRSIRNRNIAIHQSRVHRPVNYKNFRILFLRNSIGMDGISILFKKEDCIELKYCTKNIWDTNSWGQIQKCYVFGARNNCCVCLELFYVFVKVFLQSWHQSEQKLKMYFETCIKNFKMLDFPLQPCLVFPDLIFALWTNSYWKLEKPNFGSYERQLLFVLMYLISFLIWIHWYLTSVPPNKDININ